MSEFKPFDIFEASLEGVSLVEASAGTGKTFNITSLYVRAILEKNLLPSQILVMTFTEAATAELKTRIRSRLKESLDACSGGHVEDDNFLRKLAEQDYPGVINKLNRAVNSFDEAAVFTIHGFCNRLLTEYGVQFDVPPNFEMLTEPSLLMQECVDEYWRNFIQKSDNSILHWHTLDYLIDTGFGPDELRKVVKETMDDKYARIVPEYLQLSGFKDKVEHFYTVFEALKVAWKKDGNIIEDMYLNNKLNGTKFKESEKKYRLWDSLNALLNSDKPSIHVPNDLERFGTYMMEFGNKKDFEVPDLSFFPMMDRYLDLANELKALEPAFIKESLREIRQLFREKKKQRQLLDYNDLLNIVEQGLTEQSSAELRKRLAQRYPLALVDEFQDTDQVQYNILKQIYHNRPGKGLFMIGDPKQAIYGFRGADVYTYLDAKKDVTPDQAYSLDYNYRSNEGMIHGINSLFSYNPNSFIVKDIQFRKGRFPFEQKSDDYYLYDRSGKVVNPLRFLLLDDIDYSNKETLNSDIYELICREILNLLSGDFKIHDEKFGMTDVKEKHIAILVRAGKEGEAIQSHLREFGINSVFRSNTSVFKTEESEELFRILSATQKLGYEPGVRSALATSLIGMTATELKQMDRDETIWAEHVSKFMEARHTWDISGVEAAIYQLFSSFGILERISHQRAAERRISNLLHIIELLATTSRKNRFNPRTLLRWFYGKLMDESEDKASEEEQLRLESDDELVQITTMHSSKGLQYPIVFCPFLWSSKAKPKNGDILKFHKEGNIHIDISQDYVHSEKDENKNRTEVQKKAEDVRLTYVALTRAISACYVILPKYNNIHYSSLAFILNGKEGSIATDFDSIKNILAEKENIEIIKPASREETTKTKSEQDTQIPFSVAEFQRKDVFNIPKMLSYSSIVGTHDSADSIEDHDETPFTLISEPEDNELTKDRFTFPKGARAGSFLHNVLEDISFSENKYRDKIIRENLDHYGIDTIWQDTVEAWISDVLSHNLKIPNITLSYLPEDHILKEMEFYFPVRDLNVADLWQIIRPEQKISADTVSAFGFMKGFIDLTFRWNNTYYILDYKSNYLGNEQLDYDSSNLKNAINDSGYDLQYHLYTLALHRYLKNRLTSYNYETHFGGVLYLFLRGIDKKVAGSGIFYHKPEERIIRSLDELFKTGVR